jgi:hypothetical protein
MDPQHMPMPGVTFDHVGFFVNHERAPSKPGWTLPSYQIHTAVHDDQGKSASKYTSVRKKSPSSDHASVEQFVKRAPRLRVI